MSATNSDYRSSRAPPPTPIATGKGRRSAAVHDEILSEFLETSLKIPNLTLPYDFFPSRSSSPTNIIPEIGLSDLISGDSIAIQWIVAAAIEAGRFQINGGDVVSCEEVNGAMEVGALVFNSMDAKRRGLVSRFGIEEEICWRGWKNIEPTLEDVPTDTYPLFRERMEVMAAKLEMVANCIFFILCEHACEETHNHKPPNLQSVLCLRKRRQHSLDHIATEHGHGRDESSRYLSIHLPLFDDCKFLIQSSVASDSFSLPAGSILVTIGEQLKEWCAGHYTASTGVMLLDPRASPEPLFSMEFIVYSLSDSNHHLPSARSKTISIMDQLLALFLVVVIFKMQLCSILF